MSRIKAEAVARGIDVIDLGIGDPDLPTSAGIIDALCEAAKRPETHRYDESPRGWRPFLNAATAWYQREFDVALDAESEVCQLIGSKEGLAHIAWAYAQEGDAVIVPNPAYTVYAVNAAMAGAEVYETPLREEFGFLPKLEDIPSEVAVRAKLLYVCYPHNPTGAVATASFYDTAIDFCRSNDMLLVADMAYAAVAFDGFKNPTPLQRPGARECTVEFHSLSKTFNMTGWRLGFAMGNRDAVAVLQRLKSNIDSKQFPAVAQAGAYALQNESNAEALRLFERRRDQLCDGLNHIGWRVSKPRATFYVWARVPRGDMRSAQFAKQLLERANVLVIPGSGYGTEGEGYVRMSLTLLGDRQGERFAEAVRRIAASGLIPSPVARP